MDAVVLATGVDTNQRMLKVERIHRAGLTELPRRDVGTQIVAPALRPGTPHVVYATTAVERGGRIRLLDWSESGGEPVTLAVGVRWSDAT